MLSSLIKSSSRKNFPNFITGSKVVKSNIEIEKVFPIIGLANSEEPIEINFDFNNVQLDKVIHLAIKKFIDGWRRDDNERNLKGLELVKMSKTVYVLEELNRRFTKKDGIGFLNNKVVLTKSIPSYDGKPLVRVGTDLFKLTQTLLEYGRKYTHIDLVSTEEMSTQCKNLKIVFSSEGIDGAWDIATMSMRGIKSCMRWEAKQCPALVGSIVDPCCGLIYITNGEKTTYGSKMLFRAVVRLAVNSDSYKPILIVDRIYSSFYKNKPGEIGSFDKQIKTIFVDYLKKKVSNCQVVDTQSKSHLLNEDYLLPKPSNFELMRPDEVSYKDTYLNYALYGCDFYLPLIKKHLGIKDEKSNITTPKKRTKRINKSSTINL